MSAALDQWRAEVAAGTTTLGFTEWQEATPDEYSDDEGTFPYSALARMGVTYVVIEYSGANDEGWINEINPQGLPDEVNLSEGMHSTLHDTAYALLERYHGGWEINEGSVGTITVDVAARKAHIHHGDAVEHYEWTDTEVK